jgi:hypothetical protein
MSIKKRVKSFLEKSRNEESRSSIAFGRLNIDNQQTTAVPTQPLSPRPKQDPIYLPLEEGLGRSEFAKFRKVIDVSTGDTYASKYF